MQDEIDLKLIQAEMDEAYEMLEFVVTHGSANCHLTQDSLRIIKAMIAGEVEFYNTKAILEVLDDQTRLKLFALLKLPAPTENWKHEYEPVLFHKWQPKDGE